MRLQCTAVQPSSDMHVLAAAAHPAYFQGKPQVCAFLSTPCAVHSAHLGWAPGGQEGDGWTQDEPELRVQF